MAWLELFTAGIFEVVWAVSMKYSQSFTRLVPSLVTVGGMIVSFVLLSMATRELPLGTAYAVWTGIGAVGTIILGIVLFHEPMSAARVVFLLMIVGGIVGLKAVNT